MDSILVIASVFAVFALAFGVMLYFVRASKMESALQRQLDEVAGGYGVRTHSTTILKEERFSPSPQVHDLLARTPVAIPLLRLIKQSGVQWWVSTALQYSLVSAVGTSLVTYLITRSVLWTLFLTLLAGATPIFYLQILRNRRFSACSKLLPEAVHLMARGLRAGHALNAALEMVSTDIGEPLASEFRVVYEEQTLGLPLRDAIHNLLERVPNADLEFLCSALLLQRETGGNLAQILDKTSALMRDRIRLRGDVRTRTAQARASGWVLGCIPFVMFGLMEALNPGYEFILINDPTGIKLIYAGFVMLAIGILVIRKIVDIQI